MGARAEHSRHGLSKTLYVEESMTAKVDDRSNGYPDSVKSLPPSAKLVAKTLEYEGSLTQSQLTTETRLPSRTVRHALEQLEQAGVISSRISSMDARKRIYSLQQD